MRLSSSRPERRRRPTGAIERSLLESTRRRALVVLRTEAAPANRVDCAPLWDRGSLRLTPRRNTFAPSRVSPTHREDLSGEQYKAAVQLKCLGPPAEQPSSST